MENAISIVLGGGVGSRLYPLTKQRAKPAVPFGGKYRLVDIAISNCLNAGLRKIYLLTQYQSASLNHHIANTYIFDTFNRGFVQILAAEQTLESDAWFLGTADAVRKNMVHFQTQSPTSYLVMAGDQLYRMDLSDMFRQHEETGADLTIAALPVPRSRVGGLGILQIGPDRRIVRFQEKPPAEMDLADMVVPEAVCREEELEIGGQCCLASMGIYIFSAQALSKALDNTLVDFGKDVIPEAIKVSRVYAYVFNGYWEDIGTIKSFYEANLNLASINPDFNLYNETMPIYTRRRDLPPSKINYSAISQTLASEGSIITNANISMSIVGIRTIIESGANLDGVICMGADFYETPEDKEANRARGVPNIGIGCSCIIKRAIIDKNARIGDNCRIGIDNRPRPDGDQENWSIRDGIIIIPKNTVLQPGTVI
jgi:glucose-1-phosphate adenylyltransferase